MAIEQVTVLASQDYAKGQWIHICLESPFLEASTFLENGFILHSLKSFQLSQSVKKGDSVIKDFTPYFEFFHIDFTNTDQFCITIKDDRDVSIKLEATVLLHHVNV